MDHLHGAFVYSVLLHLLLLFGWELNRHFDILRTLRTLELLDPTRLIVKPVQPPKSQPVQFVFVQVDASNTEEPPPDTQLVAAHTTAAASEKQGKNPDEQARIDGDTRNSMLVKNVARPSTPSPPPAPKPEPPKPQPKPPEPKPEPPKPQPKKKTETPPPPKRPARLKPPPPPKELVPLPAPDPRSQAPLPMRKKPEPQPLLPSPKVEVVQEPKQIPIAEPKPIAPPPKRPRPRSLAEARARRAQESGIIGKKMRRDGISRKVGASNLAARGTPFGKYMDGMFEVISTRWHNLMGQRPTPHGQVKIKYKLWSDGRVTDVETLSTSIDDFQTVICQMAIKDPSPYRPWPSDMRRQFEEDFRELLITFTID
tara:strand:- start:487 stop:1593 length:1107 start_codon:yes stop_codon:yes gene_type:complete